MSVRLPTADTKRRSHVPIPEQVDVAIVGAGLGGLGAAAHLARAGHKVAIFDSHYLAGGCATMFARGSRAERYVFDVGFHYVGDAGPGGTFERNLRPLGIELNFLPMDEDGFDVLVFPDFQFKTPAGIDRYRDRLAEHFPEERRGIDRYVRFLKEVDGILGVYNNKGGKFGIDMVMQAALRGRLAAWWQGGPIGPFLNSCTRNPKLRAVMMGPHGNYALPPSRVSALLHAGLVLHYLKSGGYYLEGGGQVLSDALADRIEEAGSTVHLQTRVEGIDVQDGRAVGVTVRPRNGEPVPVKAKAVISGADLKETLLHLLPSDALPSPEQDKAANYEFPDGIFVTVLAVKDDIAQRGFGRCNYWQFDDYDVEGMYANNRKGDRPVAPACYMTSATRKDPVSHAHAPEGIHTVELMTMVPVEPEVWGITEDELKDEGYRKNPGYLERKQALEDDMVRRFERLFPGVGQHIAFKESSTPITHRRYTESPSGSGYGLSCTPEQFGQNRPGFRGPIPGLYLAGASTRAGHGIIGSLVSGRVAGRVVMKDLQG